MLSRLAQGELAKRLPADPIVNAYACLGCSDRPDELAPVWSDQHGQLEGALISFDWASYELLASTREAVRALLGCLPRKFGQGWRLTFPDWAMSDVLSRAPHVHSSYDLLHVCTPETYRAPAPSAVEIVRLTPRRVEQYAFELETVKALSGLSVQQYRHPIYGAIVDDQIVSMADGTAMTAQVAIVQQVYTVPAYRGRALAKAVVARLTEEIFALGRVATYAADYNNGHSLALCRSLGYKPVAVFGFAEYDP